MPKLVQLTDTHLFRHSAGLLKGVDTHRTLRAVVADVAEHHPDFDALLLTGDLSQDETPQSYALLKRMLAPIRRAPVYAIPGNHDDLAHMRSHLVDDDISVMADMVLGRWRVVMLNSQVPGRVHGELGADQIKRLRDSLEQSDLHTIVALHHPPVDIGSAWIDALRCLDGDDLLAGLADPPVKAVVCGHVHQAFEVKRAGTSILTTPSTCAQFKPGADEFALDDADPGYRVFDLHEDGNWSTSVRRVAVD